MSRKRKESPGKQAMLNESKFLESKGKKQKAQVPTDKAPEKGMPDPPTGRDFRGMKHGTKDSGPFGKLPAKKKHK